MHRVPKYVKKSFNILFCNDSNKITTNPTPYSNYNFVSIPLYKHFIFDTIITRLSFQLTMPDFKSTSGSKRLTNQEIENITGYRPRCSYGGYLLDDDTVRCALPKDHTVEVIGVILGLSFITIITTILIRYWLQVRKYRAQQSQEQHERTHHHNYSHYYDLMDISDLLFAREEVNPVPLYTRHADPTRDWGTYDDDCNLNPVPVPVPVQVQLDRPLPSYSTHTVHGGSASRTRTTSSPSRTQLPPPPEYTPRQL